jgi:transposase-like protein
MKYTLDFQESIVKKALTSSVREVSEETGISGWSIYRWIKEHGNGNMVASRNGPRSLTLPQKHALLLEYKTIAGENAGEWLRKNGLCSDHLEKWQKEISEAMGKNSEEKIEIRKLKDENEALKKELRRKEKALAEVSALLVLKKKLSHLWEDEEK